MSGKSSAVTSDMSSLTAELPLGRALSGITAAPHLLIVYATLAVAALMLTGVLVVYFIDSHSYSGLPLDSAVRRVARNSAIPMAAQLVNRAVDFGFTLVVLRVLGATGTGQYEYAVLVWLYTKTLSDFGLSVLTTREVAVAPARASQFLGATTLVRLGIWASTLPLVAAFTVANVKWSGLSLVSAATIAILMLSIVPDVYSDSANAICNAFERMAAPALLTVVKNLIKVALGLLLLGLGWGVVSLAIAALVNNLLVAGLFVALMRRLGIRARWSLPASETRQLLAAAWPLLLNNLLAGLFFRADIFVLQPARGAHEVGIYSAPYKFLSLAGIIPSYFTLALFPHFSRLATIPGHALRAAYGHAGKLLLVVALGIVFITELFATDLMRLLAGEGFLPGSANALRILILFLPLSYVNGLTQYLLIAAGQQRRLVLAFGLTFAFNIGANLAFTARYGYPAAAIVTVLSEVVLLVPFAVFVHRSAGLPSIGENVARPLVSAIAMVAAGALGWRLVPESTASRAWVAAIAGLSAYAFALAVSRTIGAAEWRLARRLFNRNQ